MVIQNSSKQGNFYHRALSSLINKEFFYLRVMLKCHSVCQLTLFAISQVHQLRLLLASDNQKRSDFIDKSLRNNKSLQALREDLNDSLLLVSRQLESSVLECETQRLDKSIRGEQLRTLLNHN